MEKIDLNDEIMQDFLVEASEILDCLNEQLVDLEARPDNTELLNAIFRSFHTIKGGAGFLSINALVDICHNAENIFDLLRNGKRRVDPVLMDTILKVTDVIHMMFSDIQEEKNPAPMAADLLQQLQKLAVPAEEEQATSKKKTQKKKSGNTKTRARKTQAKPTKENPDKLDKPEFIDDKKDGITDEEFEDILDQLQSEKKGIFAQDLSSSKEQKQSAGKNKITCTESTVRVETKTLDKIMNIMGELVLVRNRIARLGVEINHTEMSKTINNLDVVTTKLRNAIMQTRMQPIRRVFGRFPRVVRDLARNMQKEIELKMIGEDTELDKNLIELLVDPLIHLLRNAADHGIETIDEREAKGKPKHGSIVLSAEQEGGHVLLSITDDGRGLDAEKIKKKAINKGLLDAAAANKLSQDECYDLIFLPGFSTKETVSNISGRGVGMDIVKTQISQLSGVFDISSTPDKGTIFRIKMPLTLAIMPTLMFMLSKHGQVFALPLVHVKEIINLDKKTVNVVNGQHTIVVRGKPLPLFYLSDLLKIKNANNTSENAHVIIASIGVEHVGLLVDKLIGREEVLIKPLSDTLKGARGLAGATITGDGKIAIILDLPKLIQPGKHRMHSQPQQKQAHL